MIKHVINLNPIPLSNTGVGLNDSFIKILLNYVSFMATYVIYKRRTHIEQDFNVLLKEFIDDAYLKGIISKQGVSIIDGDTGEVDTKKGYTHTLETYLTINKTYHGILLFILESLDQVGEFVSVGCITHNPYQIMLEVEYTPLLPHF